MLLAAVHNSNTNNFILIVLDTLRKDYFQKYIEDSISRFDGIGRPSIRYNNAISTSNWTIPSHVSMFTGRSPDIHGVHETKNMKSPELFEKISTEGVPNKENLIARIAQREGYNTVSFASNAYFSPGSGLNYGFNLSTYYPDISYELENPELLGMGKVGDTPEGKGLLKQIYKKEGVSGIVKSGFDYMKIKKIRKFNNYPLIKGADRIIQNLSNSTFEQPFFLFINFMEAHEPYITNEYMKLNQNLHLAGVSPIKSSIIKEIREKYESEAILLKTMIFNLMETLKNMQLLDNTTLIFTSDHGQALNEQGFYGHGIFHYDSIIKSPLVIKPSKGMNLNRPHDAPISTKEIYYLMKGIVEGDVAEFNNSSDIVFCDSFGIEQSLSMINKLNSAQREDFLKKYDCRRVSAFDGKYKVTINMDRKQIEEITKEGLIVDPNTKNENIKKIEEEIYIYSR